jgi:hypothetical protein
MINDWNEFKIEFLKYILNTIGLFTVYEPSPIFNLDNFLKIKKIHTITQIEMLMSLSTFIEIVEGTQNLELEIFPTAVIIQLKGLVLNNLLKLHQFSILKNKILEYEDKFEIEI